MEAGFEGVIFDVDGVLVDSPHERAWRETLQELMDGRWHDVGPRARYTPERFTSRVYQDVVAGKPRLDGARAALEYFGLPDADSRAGLYAELKQARVLELIGAGDFEPFPDAIRFALALSRLGLRLAAASSSKNAGLMLDQIRLASGQSLRDLLTADLSGQDFARGKPDPMIFLAARDALGLASGECFVVEDAVAGIQAAKAGGLAALGISRADDVEHLAAAGADLVVTTLDDVDLEGLRQGRLGTRGTHDD